MNSIEIQKVNANETLAIRHLVLWPGQSAEFVKVAEDESGFHFGLYINAQLVSVISLFADGNSMRFRKFATLPEFQGKGMGSQLLEHSIAFARQNQFRRMWCDARTDALGFYERFGFTKFSEPFFKEDVEYHKIEKVL
jgi:GNAT superfamily N-acetyltransferase